MYDHQKLQITIWYHLCIYMKIIAKMQNHVDDRTSNYEWFPHSGPLLPAHMVSSFL